MPQNTGLYKKRSDPRPFADVMMTPSYPGGSGDPTIDMQNLREATANRAHDTAVQAGGFLTTAQRRGKKFGGSPVDAGT